MFLSRAQALQISKRVFSEVEVPELDGKLRLTSLAAGPSLAVQEFLARQAKGEEVTRQMMVLALASAVVDEKGDPLFDLPAANEFFDRVSLPAVFAIVAAIPGFKKGTAEAPAVPPSP